MHATPMNCHFPVAEEIPFFLEAAEALSAAFEEVVYAPDECAKVRASLEISDAYDLTISISDVYGFDL